MEYFLQYEFGEKVDVVFNDKFSVGEGVIKSVRGQKMIIQINNEDKVYDRNSPLVLKQWKPGMEIKVYNRVDFKSKNSKKYEQGFVYDIKADNIVIRGPFGDEILSKEDVNYKICEIGKYTNLNYYNNMSNIDIRRAFINQQIFKQKIDEMFLPEDKNLDEETNITNLKNSNFKEIEITGDGNCLYRALAYLIYEDEGCYQTVKNCILDYIELKKEFFGNFILGGVENLNIYLNLKRREGIWGDDIEIQAFTEIYKKGVCICGGNMNIIKSFHEFNNVKERRNFFVENVFLMFSNEHYNALILPDFKKIISSEPGYFEKEYITDVSNQIENDNANANNRNSGINYDDYDLTNNYEEEATDKNDMGINNKSIKAVVEMGFSIEEATLAFTYAGDDVDLMLQYIYSLNYI